MPHRMAFIGFRHGHINGLYATAAQHPDIEIVGACEDHEPTRLQLQDEINFTHTSADEMLASVECDSIAVGDYYARRGSHLIKALEAGRHIIADKPICTELAELDRIEALVKEKGLCAGCMLDLRDAPDVRTIKRLLDENAIGTVRTISFGGQHPLMYGSRADWYFEEGKHGGTLNDIAIHGIDLAEWLTGSQVAAIVGARSWNAALQEVPWFHDGGQCLLKLENGCGVMGDVSYLSPDSFGYTMPLYWRITLHGDDGIIETNRTGLTLYKNGETEARTIELDSGAPNGYLEAFLADVGGSPLKGELDTAQVLQSARVTLLCQKEADK